MTRNEAISKIDTALFQLNVDASKAPATAIACALEALGIVAFEQPKTVSARVVMALQNRFGVNNLDALALLKDFERDGLKVVQA